MMHPHQLLMRAGDVERNPGPPCAACKKAIRKNTVPVLCGGCGAEFHRSCTEQTRGEKRRGESYRCGACLGVNPIGEEPGRPEEDTGSCVVCGVGLRRGAAFASCRECNARAHKKCTGLRRGYEGNWRCAGCSLDPPPQQQEDNNNNEIVEVPAPINKKCPECQGLLRKAARPLICRECKRTYHLKCAKETRAALEQARDAGTWNCRLCIEQMAAGRREDPMVEQECIKGSKVREGLRLLQWNADYLATKTEELGELLRREKVDIAAVQETKLISGDPTPFIHGYNTIRHDRVGQERGGGLAFLVKQGIGCWTTKYRTLKTVEAFAIKLASSGGRTLTILNIYIPPTRENRADQERRVMEEVRQLPRGRDTIWVGDFNAHHPMWDAAAEEDDLGGLLAEYLAEEQLVTLNTGEATWYARREGCRARSAPDITVVQAEMAARTDWRIHQDLSSDHLPIAIQWKMPFLGTSNPKRKVRANVAKTDWEKYKVVLDEKMPRVEEAEDPREKYKNLAAVIQEAAREATPVSVCREGEDRWMTTEIKRTRRERNRLRRDLRRRRREWVQKNEELKRLTREAKSRVWKANLEKIERNKDTTGAWRVVKQLSGRRTSGNAEALVFRGGRRITDESKARAFNQEYAEVSQMKGDKETRRLGVTVAVRLRGRTTEDEAERDFTRSELDAAVQKMKPRKAAGCDGIASDYVRNLTDRAREQLLLIYNHSWRRKWIPQVWRTAIVVPILKKGKSPEAVGNYRPISLLSNMGKLMERLVAERLTWWLESRRLISDKQAGFRRGRSTVDQCLRVSQTVSNGFQKKPPLRTLMVLYDYSRAFDTVWRAALLHKMLNMGVPRRHSSSGSEHGWSTESLE